MGRREGLKLFAYGYCILSTHTKGNVTIRVYCDSRWRIKGCRGHQPIIGSKITIAGERRNNTTRQIETPDGVVTLVGLHPRIDSVEDMLIRVRHADYLPEKRLKSKSLAQAQQARKRKQRLRYHRRTPGRWSPLGWSQDRLEQLFCEQDFHPNQSSAG